MDLRDFEVVRWIEDQIVAAPWFGRETQPGSAPARASRDPFASDHARFTYFRTPGRDPSYAAYDDTKLTVTVLSGLPGVGKDRWIAANRPDLPLVSLDAIRARLGVAPGADQRPVAAAAYEQARTFLRAGQSFVWNATNISRQQRELCIGLAADYRARIELIALEATITCGAGP